MLREIYDESLRETEMHDEMNSIRLLVSSICLNLSPKIVEAKNSKIKHTASYGASWWDPGMAFWALPDFLTALPALAGAFGAMVDRRENTRAKCLKLQKRESNELWKCVWRACFIRPHKRWFWGTWHTAHGTRHTAYSFGLFIQSKLPTAATWTKHAP